MPDHSTKETNQPPASPQDRRGQAQQGPGEPSPGLKDKEAETSNSYGDTRESGEEPK